MYIDEVTFPIEEAWSGMALTAMNGTAFAPSRPLVYIVMLMV